MSSAEALQYYADALKQGQREYKNCVHRGRYPYIQSLQQARQKPLSQIALGAMEIPIYLVVGSTQDARCNSFSPSFFPLLDQDTEFAAKWTNLCKAQLTEGIHDPIKCYEYLGRFYVEEGNKRVSVLKSLGSATIRAEVIRLMPEQTEDITVQIYMEFLDFFRCSKCWGVHFTEPGGYAALQAALGFSKDQPWPEDFQRKFKRHYFSFRDSFYRLGGGGLGITAGDALVRWLSFHTGMEFLTMEAEDYRQTLSAVWKELCVFTDTQPIAVSLAPMGEEKRSGSGLLASFGRRKLRCAFLFQKNPQTSAWTASHDKGREYLEETLGDSVSVSCYYDVDPQGAEAVVEEAVADGAELIFTTSVSLIDATLRVAVKYPKVRFLNCSIDQPYVNVKAYYCRVYEAKFITGAIAGALCKNGQIGYVGSYPILSVPASINAFALGAQLTNPRAEITLRWSCVEEDALDALAWEGVSLISNRDIPTPDRIREPWGLCRIENGKFHSLASPYWHWGNVYTNLIRSVLSGGWEALSAPDGQAVNYWWGMDIRAVDILLGDDLPAGVRHLAGILRKGIIDGSIQPFPEATPEKILHMDTLLECVHGSIPKYEDLLPMARPIARLQGVYRDAIPPEKEDPIL